MGYPLIFRRQIKELLDLPEMYTTQDAAIDQCIKVATSFVEDQLNRSLTKAEHTEYLSTKKNYTERVATVDDIGASVYRTEKSGTVLLKHYPVDTTAQFKVYFDTNRAFAETSLLDPSLYFLDAEKGTLDFNFSTGAYKNCLKVVYTAGYEATADTNSEISDGTELALANNIHPDIVQATIWQAALVYQKRYIAQINVRDSTSQGSTNSSRYVNVQGISPEASALLVKHRRYRSAIV